MIKDFKELYNLDVSARISKKPVFKWDKVQQKTVDTGERLDYINWADCVCLLHDNGAEKVLYDTIKSDSGHSLFLCKDNLPEIRVFVDIDGDRRELTYPLIEGTKDITMEKISQSDIHNATQRAFVKCVAVNWGLGLSLWQKEEKKIPVESPKNEDAFSLHDRLTRKANNATRKLGSIDALHDAIGMSTKDIKKIIGYTSQIADLENALDGVLSDH